MGVSKEELVSMLEVIMIFNYFFFLEWTDSSLFVSFNLITLKSIVFFFLQHTQEEELKKAILVVLANKQDLEGALSVTEIYQQLGLDALKTRTLQIFKTSAIKGEGLNEAMEW